MSAPRSSTSTSTPPSFLSGLAARFGGMLIGSSPVSMPVPRVSSPVTTASDGKPRPVLPPMPQMLPMPSNSAPNSRSSSRPPHIADRPNPYDVPVLTMPQPQILHFPSPPLSPLPNPWEEHPPILPHAHSDPPPSLRLGYATPPTPSKPSPKISPLPNEPPLSQNAPNQSKIIKFPRHSVPRAPKVVDSHLAPLPTRARASSEPPSPTTPRRSDGAVQCSGKCTSKDGERCTRVVITPHPFILATHAEDGDIQRFCYQHINKHLEPSGIADWIQFDDWIPSYLSSVTKVALRIEMNKKPSPKDTPGYIYCYEIRDPKATNQVRLKVGRTAKVEKRFNEWGKKCEKEVVPRGLWPIPVDGACFGLVRGQIEAREKSKYSHKLERLIHLELSDLVIHKAYLTPGFPKSSKGAEEPSPDSPPRKRPVPVREKCACGTMHKEIFTFTRVRNGPLKGREWDDIVQPVIERWGRFVQEKLEGVSVDNNY